MNQDMSQTNPPHPYARAAKERAIHGSSSVIVLVVLCICCLVAGGGYYLYQNGDKLLRHWRMLLSSSLRFSLLQKNGLRQRRRPFCFKDLLELR